MQNKAWLKQQVNNILEPLLLKMCQEKPSNHIKYMVNYMEETYGEQALNGDKDQAAMLKAKIEELERKLEQ